MKTKKYKIDSSSIDNSFNVNQSVATVNDLNSNIKTGKKYIMGAWVFEILACLLGLTIAFSLAQKSGNASEATTNSWNAMVIGAGLIIVALSELAKVPFSIALIKVKNWLVKGLCIVALTVVVVATFLNVYRALDQFYANRAYPIQTAKDEIQNINRKLVFSNEKIKTNGDFKSQYETDLDALDNVYAESETSIEKAFIAGQVSIGNKYKGQLASIQRDIQETQSQITINDANEITAQIGKRNRVQTEIREKHARIRKDLLNDLKKFQTKETETQEYIRSDIADLEKDRNEQLEGLRKDRDANKGKIETISNSIQSLKEENKGIINEIETFKNNKIQQENLLASLVFDLETYRFAKWWYGKDDPAELNADQVGLITITICAVLALIPALVGVFLALFGTVLQLQRTPKLKNMSRFLMKLTKRLLSKKRTQTSTRKKSRLGYRFNALLIALRKRLLKPKIITKIKEVEKEVEIEKIKEILVYRDKVITVTNEVPKIIEKEIIVEVPKVEIVETFIGVPVPKDHDYFLNHKHDSLAAPKTISEIQKIETNGKDRGVDHETDH